MPYLIEEIVMFDEVKVSLSNIETQDEVSLTPTAGCILHFLFKNESSTVERNQLLEQIYKKFGFDLSNNTLNQYISLLRKNIRNLGIESDVILTVPRVGFCISPDVDVVRKPNYFPGLAELWKNSKKGDNKKLMMTAIIMALVIIVEVIYLSLSAYAEPEQYPLKKKEKLESVIYIYLLISVGFNRQIGKILQLNWRTDTCLAGQVRFSSTI